MKLGIGKELIGYNDACFPTDGFIGVHDGSYVRTMVFENEDGSRYAISALDITGMFDFSVSEFKKILMDNAQVDISNSKICATHNFTSPHMWEVPEKGMKDTSIRPGHPLRTEEELEACRNINEAVRVAFKTAVTKALQNMQEVVCGADYGYCKINTNRNAQTRDGWWIGTDEEGYSDHVIPVIRFDDLAGNPVGLIFAYDCQSSVMGKTQRKEGGKLVTSDLLGHAALYVEKEYGHDFTALALCGACGDQEPLLKATRTEIDIKGQMRTEDVNEEGFVLLKIQGAILGADVVKASERIDDLIKAEVDCRKANFTAETKQMERNLKNLRPTRKYEYNKDGEKEVIAGVVSIGDFALVTTQAEMASISAHSIRTKSPFKVTAVANMVDGGAKYMMDEESYDSFKYGAINSMYMKGTAEKLEVEALKVLKDIYNCKVNG